MYFAQYNCGMWDGSAFTFTRVCSKIVPDHRRSGLAEQMNFFPLTTITLMSCASLWEMLGLSASWIFTNTSVEMRVRREDRDELHDGERGGEFDKRRQIDDERTTDLRTEK